MRPHSAGSDRPDVPAGPHKALIAEDLARAYQELTADERGFRDLESSDGMRPVFHHREDRIRAHVPLCWLALLLIRVAENAAVDTWRTTRHELDRMDLVTLAAPDGPPSPGESAAMRTA